MSSLRRAVWLLLESIGEMVAGSKAVELRERRSRRGMATRRERQVCQMFKLVAAFALHSFPDQK